MTVTAHLKSLQALDSALRNGSLKNAADELGITPAAVGQRVRSLEDYLGTDLLVRGRSGLKPTRELEHALADLFLAFDALNRVSETLDFQRMTEIHMVADPDWAELWLLPKLPQFQNDHPRIKFCINGEGDIPLRLGAPDIRVEFGGTGEELFTDHLLPVCGPDNLRRIGDWDSRYELEGLPLLHLEGQRDQDDRLGWPDWIASFELRQEGLDRGIYYKHARVAMEAVRQNVGFLVCGHALVQRDIESGQAFLLYPPDKHIIAPQAYRMTIQNPDRLRPQLLKFVDWIRQQARDTRTQILM